jgi:D-hexose-6-phosphate mutarotase
MVTLASESREVLTVNPEGAFVESWLSAEGKELLFARRDMPETGKNRGGVPVCAPIFGPGETVGLSQHGFARNCLWEVDEQTESQVKLSLDNPLSQVEDLPPVYAGLSMELTVELIAGGLRETLLLRNIGTEPCMVNPAFHPYFPVYPDGTAEVIIDSRSYQLSDEELAATRKVDSLSSQAQLVTAQGTWTVTSEGLPLFALWSESPADFICVEPTESGYLIDNPAAELLPNASKTVSLTILFAATQPDAA